MSELRASMPQYEIVKLKVRSSVVEPMRVRGVEGWGGLGRDVTARLSRTWTAAYSLTTYASQAPLDGNDPDSVIERIKREWEHVEGHSVSDVDGVRIDSSEWWVHLRKSNTEPIVRVIGEANDAQRANEICQRFLKLIVETGEHE